MGVRKIGLIALVLLAGTADAQVTPGGGSATEASRLDAEVAGPHGSIGTAGESPTKSALEDGKKEGQSASGLSSKRLAPGTFTSPDDLSGPYSGGQAASGASESRGTSRAGAPDAAKKASEK